MSSNQIHSFTPPLSLALKPALQEESSGETEAAGAMSEAFMRAAEEAKVLKQRPDGAELASLYGLYKQALTGDVNTDSPGIFYFVAREKWKAWNAQKGLSQDDAAAEYIRVVETLKDKYGME